MKMKKWKIKIKKWKWKLKNDSVTSSLSPEPSPSSRLRAILDSGRLRLRLRRRRFPKNESARENCGISSWIGILYFVFVFAHLIHALWFLDNWYFETNILPGQSVHINLLHLNINLTLERKTLVFSQQFYCCFPTFLLSLNISRKTAGSRTLSAWKMAWLILKLSKLKQRLECLIWNFHWVQYLKGYVLLP